MYSRINNKNKRVRSRKYQKKARNRQSRKLRKYRGGATTATAPAPASAPASAPAPAPASATATALAPASATATVAKSKNGFGGLIDKLQKGVVGDPDVKRISDYGTLLDNLGSQIKEINKPTVEEKKKQLTNDLPNLVKKAIEMHKSEQYKHHESSKKLKKVDDENQDKLKEYEKLHNGQKYILPVKQNEQIKAMLQEFKKKTNNELNIPEIYKSLTTSNKKSSPQKSSLQ